MCLSTHPVGDMSHDINGCIIDIQACTFGVKNPKSGGSLLDVRFFAEQVAGLLQEQVTGLTATSQASAENLVLANEALAQRNAEARAQVRARSSGSMAARGKSTRTPNTSMPGESEHPAVVESLVRTHWKYLGSQSVRRYSWL